MYAKYLPAAWNCLVVGNEADVYVGYYPGDFWNIDIKAKNNRIERNKPVYDIELDSSWQENTFVDTNLVSIGTEDLDEIIYKRDSIEQLPYPVPVGNSSDKVGPFALHVNPSTQTASISIIERRNEVHCVEVYPNPVDQDSKLFIDYKQIEWSRVKFSVYDILGNEVMVLVDQDKPAGIYNIEWDIKDKNGKLLQKGVYIYNYIATSYAHMGTLYGVMHDCSKSGKIILL